MITFIQKVGWVVESLFVCETVTFQPAVSY